MQFSAHKEVQNAAKYTWLAKSGGELHGHCFWSRGVDRNSSTFFGQYILNQTY